MEHRSRRPPFLCVIGTVFGAVLAGLLESKKLHLSDDSLEFYQMVVMIVFFQSAALGWVAVFLRQSNISWREAFGLRPLSRARTVAAGLAIGLLVVPGVWMLQVLSETVMERLGFRPVAQTAVAELQKNTLSVAQIVLMGIFTILIAPVAEEALFRGILYPTIKQTGHPRLALWVSSVLFGLMHFNAGTLVPLILLAALLVILYEASGSLLAPIATHSMFNAVNFFILILGDSGRRLLHLS